MQVTKAYWTILRASPGIAFSHRPPHHPPCAMCKSICIPALVLASLPNPPFWNPFCATTQLCLCNICLKADIKMLYAIIKKFNKNMEETLPDCTFYTFRRSPYGLKVECHWLTTRAASIIAGCARVNILCYSQLNLKRGANCARWQIKWNLNK